MNDVSNDATRVEDTNAMSNILSEPMHAAKNGIDSAKDSAAHAFETAKEGATSAKEGTLQTVAEVVSMVLKGVSAAGAIVGMLQKLDSDDGLAWLGLSRRRSPLLTVALLGAGAAAGAGVALWFAPMAGADLRALLTGRGKRATGESEPKVQGAAANHAAGAEATRTKPTTSQVTTTP